jgi:hypothetical protein
MGFLNYGWALGWNVADNSLTNPEDDLYVFTKPKWIEPVSDPIAGGIIESIAMSGWSAMHGRRDFFWVIPVCPLTGLDWIYDTFYPTNDTALMTVRQRNHVTGVYTRYNVYAKKPQPPSLERAGDYIRRDTDALNLILRYRRAVPV